MCEVFAGCAYMPSAFEAHGMDSSGANVWGGHTLSEVIKDTLIEHATILPRTLLCNHNKYIFNDRPGIYILEMALGNRS